MRGRPLVTMSEIAQAADAFRRQFAPNTVGPIPIDTIVEHDMGIEIFAVPKLCRRTRSKAWVCNNGKMIVVDKNIMLRQPIEYRQVIAHEAAHVHRHLEYFPKAPFTSPEDCRHFHETLSPALLAAIEWEATNWAGHVLVPSRELEIRVRAAVQELGWVVEAFGADGGPIMNDLVVESVAAWFRVLPSVAERRMRDEHLFGLVRSAAGAAGGRRTS